MHEYICHVHRERKKKKQKIHGSGLERSSSRTVGIHSGCRFSGNAFLVSNKQIYSTHAAFDTWDTFFYLFVTQVTYTPHMQLSTLETLLLFFTYFLRKWHILLASSFRHLRHLFFTFLLRTLHILLKPAERFRKSGLLSKKTDSFFARNAVTLNS